MEKQQEGNRMKQVLNIVPYSFLPYFSGGQKLIAHFNEYLGEQCVLHIAGTSNNDFTHVKNYSLHGLLSKSRFRYADLFSFFRLKKLIKEKQIDTVIVEHPYLGWLGWMLKKACSIKLVIHTHNIEHERFRTIGKSWWPLLKIYESWVLKNADIVFCISEEDRQSMIEKMKLLPQKCILVPYGITQKESPTDKRLSKELVCSKHGLNPDHTLLFFNGLLDYKPNLDAIKAITEKINPLLQQSELSCYILIAGKRLPASFNELKAWNKQHVFYAGFVEDIDLYTKAADILLNPVNSGGGVKTKMIEALGLNTSVVATESGSIGVNKKVCGNKLKVVKDNDWVGFSNEVIISAAQVSTTPITFYNEYYWRNIISKCLQYL